MKCLHKKIKYNFFFSVLKNADNDIGMKSFSDWTNYCTTLITWMGLTIFKWGKIAKTFQ